MSKAVLRAHVWLVAALIPGLDRLLAIKSLLRVITPPRGLAPYRCVATEEIVGIVDRRLARPRRMKRRRCLRHGLVLYHALCLAGREPILIFGVFPWEDNRRGLAHCWVELDGQALSEKPEAAVAVVLRHTRGPGG